MLEEYKDILTVKEVKEILGYKSNTTLYKILKNGDIKLTFEEKQRAVTPGQYAVLYAEDGMCYGGALILSTK